MDSFEVNPAGLDVHAYVLSPTALAPMPMDSPKQIAALVPALAAGNGLTVTTTSFDAVQPAALIVSTSVYVVVIVGETDGLEEDDVKPEGLEVHE